MWIVKGPGLKPAAIDRLLRAPGTREKTQTIGVSSLTQPAPSPLHLPGRRASVDPAVQAVSDRPIDASTVCMFVPSSRFHSSTHNWKASISRTRRRSLSSPPSTTGRVAWQRGAMSAEDDAMMVVSDTEEVAAASSDAAAAEAPAEGDPAVEAAEDDEKCDDGVRV